MSKEYSTVTHVWGYLMVKVRLTVSVQPELVKWIDEEIVKGHFADRSHAIQFSIRKTKELIDKKEIKF
jgi:Arc/MetJ-type ribon-helix-helix transcriptional regulator